MVMNEAEIPFYMERLACRKMYDMLVFRLTANEINGTEPSPIQ